MARLSWSVPVGASVLLTGHNGSGKTTLLRLLATAIRASAGTVQVLGLDAATQREDIRAQVGLLSHANFLYEDLDAHENLGVVARLLGRSGAEVPELLGRVGLAERGRDPVRVFSAGMRKRLAIARLLLQAPRLALLDEPFGELDPAGIAEMEAHIRELRATGVTLVIATHQVSQGLALCTERLHLEDGRSAAA